MAPRDYQPALAAARRSSGSRDQRMQAVVDSLWEAVRDTGYSWVGFYTKSPDGEELVLGPRRDKPACSPIPMHGVCGQCWTARRPILVTDAMKLGAGSYVACDPKDRAEVVIPLLGPGGECWGVLDADSHESGVFDERDVDALTAIALAAGLTTPAASLTPIRL